MATIKNISEYGATKTVKVGGLVTVLAYGDFGGGTATIEASADSNSSTVYSTTYEDPLYPNPQGVISQLIRADCSAEGEGNYYVQCEVKPNTPYYINGTSLGVGWNGYVVSIPDAALVVTTSDTVLLTPDNVGCGFIGDGGAEWQGNYRNLKLYKQLGAAQDIENDKLCAWWKMQARTAGTLDGVIEKDSIGNYDGQGNVSGWGADQGTWVSIKDKFNNTPSMTANDSFTLDIGNLGVRGILRNSTDGDLNFAFADQSSNVTFVNNA
jgi:hypothetical protein